MSIFGKGMLWIFVKRDVAIAKVPFVGGIIRYASRGVGEENYCSCRIIMEGKCCMTCICHCGDHCYVMADGIAAPMVIMNGEAYVVSSIQRISVRWVL